MDNILIRVEADDFETWLGVHNAHLDQRAEYGLSDGPLYRDVNNPNAALVHLQAEDLGRALGWFKTPAFQEGTRAAGVKGRVFYTAHEGPARS